jgi:hypothetical protein
MQVVERFAWMQLDDTPGIHSRLREKTAQARAEVEQTRRDLAAAAAGTAQLSQVVARQQGETAQARAEVEQTRRDLAAAAAGAAQLSEVVARQQGETASLAQIISDRMRKLEAAQIQLDAIRASKSWRVTAPLRAMRRMIQPKRRQSIAWP